ncbi:MAG: aminodeoxychorismate synthase component I [Steroidobacteraceae bacterium]
METTADVCIWPLGQLAPHELLSLHAAYPERYPYLLESAAGSALDNNDILLAFPGAQLSLHSQHGLSLPAELGVTQSTNFLDALDQWWQQLRQPETTQAPVFAGGWFVYLSYELARQIEPSLQPAPSPVVTQLLAQAVRIPAAIIRRSDTGTSWFVSENEAAAESRLTQLRQDLHAARAAATILLPVKVYSLQEDTPAVFIDAVHAALAHIAAGDVYQANLSRGWQAKTPDDSAAALYQALKAANPAPFSGLARLSADHFIISSSPERLIEVRDGWANTRPIAGTRPRDTDTQTDQALLTELQAHPKERAEHIMLLDLERNDLGRICQAGTVEVNEYMSIESYAHVHHIVSNVRGRLRSDVTPGMAIAAVFPGGTITGCPKVRCMQIIASLEPETRGAYTGSMGYLNRDGSMDLNILIRTLELQETTLRFRAGGGIVADSIPECELDETRAKALGLLRALQA